jgi:predicted dehydrogenase
VTLGVAIIGAGLIGEKRARALPPSTALRFVFDPERDRAEGLAARFPGAEASATIEDAVGAADVGLAIVATPHDQLGPIALQALGAGCDVLVEKPGAHRLDVLEGVRDAAVVHGRRVRVGFNHRFHPGFAKARAIVTDAEHGPVTGVRARYGHGGRPGYADEWRAQREISGGGELIDQGLHLVDLTRCLVGDVTLAFAELRTDFWPMEVEDNAYLALHADRTGAFAWLHASWTEWKNLFSFEVTMRTAKVEIQGLGGSYGTERLTCYAMTPEMGPPVTAAWEWPQADRSWALELEDVVADLGGATPQGADIDDAIAAFEIADEAYRR